MSKENTAMTTQEYGYLALANSDLGALMAEELDGLDAGFERIRIPSGGGLAFEIPGEDGEPEMMREFSAVILHHHPLNSYYKTKFTGGNNPPDCGSYDGVFGVGDPGGNCAACPCNQYGSGENGGKACQNRRRLFVLRENEIFPLVMSIPTGSLPEFARYIKRLISKGRKSNAVVTCFTLKKATNKGGVVYSQAQFAIDRPLSPEEHTLIAKLSTQIKSFSAKVPLEADAQQTGAMVVDPETGEVMESVAANV
jgi:hypothetical protein